MDAGDVASCERFSPEVRFGLHAACHRSGHAEMEALDVLLEQWQRTEFSAMEVTEKLSACSFM